MQLEPGTLRHLFGVPAKAAPRIWTARISGWKGAFIPCAGLWTAIGKRLSQLYLEACFHRLPGLNFARKVICMNAFLFIDFC